MSENRVQWDVYVAFTATKKYTVYAESHHEALANGEDDFFEEIGKMKTLELSVDRIEAGRTDGQ
jgi:hypothetical protein